MYVIYRTPIFVCFFTASVSFGWWHIHKCYINQALEIQMPNMDRKIS